MTIDIRTQLNETVARQIKAIKWLHAASLDLKVTDIGRLASHMKLRKDEAITLVKEIIHGLGYSDEWSTAQYLAVFVPSTQLPDWLRPILTGVQKTKVLMTARNRNMLRPSRCYRATLMKLFAENIPNLRERVISEMQLNEQTATFALCHAGMDAEIVESSSYEHLQWIDHLKHGTGHGGNSLPGVKYRDGTTISMNFGCYTYEAVDKLNFEQRDGRKIVYRPRRDEVSSDMTKIAIAATLEKTQVLVDAFALRDMQLIDTSFSLIAEGKNKSKTRGVLVFMRKGELLSLVRMTLPWDNFAVSIEA